MAILSTCRSSRTCAARGQDRRRAGLFQPRARPWPVTCRPHNHRPAGCPHSRSIARRFQPCPGRPRIRKPQRVATVLPTVGHPPHEPRTGRPWCGPFRGRAPASGSRRKRTMAQRGWYATGVHRAPSATTLSASPSRPRSSGPDARHDRPGSAPAGTASRTKRTSRPSHGSPARSTPCCSRSAVARPSPGRLLPRNPGRHIWDGSCAAPAGSPE